MLHRASSWRPAGPSRAAAAAATLRPRSFVFKAVAAATVLVHGLLIGWAWQGVAAKREPARSARVAMRLIAAPAAHPHPVEVARLRTAPQPARPEPKATRRPRNDDMAHEKPKPLAAPPASAEPIVGIALAVPTISLPGAAPKRWVNPPPAPTAAQASPPAMLAAWAQAEAARNASRSQLEFALQRHLAEASPPSPDVEGACTLPAEPQADLDCDTDGMMQALGPRAAALSGLLLALRSMEPRTSGLAIAVVQGRYQASWTMHAQ